MNARRFTGATSREVLAQVRDALGPDAIILSNRGTALGMEVLAVGLEDVRVDAAAPRPQRAAPPRAPERLREPPPATPRIPSVAPAAAPAAHVHALPFSTRDAALVDTRPAAVAAPEKPPALNGVLAEIQSMRELLKRELTAIGYASREQRDPGGTAALRELLGAGFTPTLAHGVMKGLPPAASADETLRQIRERMEKHLPLADTDSVVDRGGVYALLGPTGVGKTTTVAKLAARAVVRHGARRVALLTSDSYRIAGFDQLRVYARILGVGVEPVRDAAGFARALHGLKDKHLVLVDTAGTSQRDDMVAEQAALFGAGDVQRLLLLNATCGTATLDDVVTAYRKHGIEGAIITKTDEAASLAAAVECLLRHRLPLHYVANGQRVPEDLHLPNASWLTRSALKLAAGAGDHKPANEDLPLMMSGGCLA